MHEWILQPQTVTASRSGSHGLRGRADLLTEGSRDGDLDRVGTAGDERVEVAQHAQHVVAVRECDGREELCKEM